MPNKSPFASLHAELSGAGVSLDRASSSDALLGELDNLLRPHLHEQRVVTGGIVCASPFLVPAGAQLIQAQQVPLEAARQIADGTNTFVAFDAGTYHGVLILRRPCTDEHALVRLRASTRGLVATIDPKGITKFFVSTGVVLHELRRWSRKFPIDAAIRSLTSHAEFLEAKHVRRLLKFCYYTLSPRRIGATLVWYIKAPSQQARDQARGLVSLDAFPFNVIAQKNPLAFSSILDRNDGAALLASNGDVLGVGAHLAFTIAAERHVRQSLGTRHTSAQRYSYDNPEAVVFTVSADGPVSVFSDGARITELRLSDASDEARFLRNVAPDRDDIQEHEWEQACGNCGKTSLLGDVLVPGWRDRETVVCPVCCAVLASGMTFQMSARVIKKLDPSPG